ncbi:MAG TPA: hypothetical protein VFC23_01090 [Thermoanaerobaculia bacterium]|nr:hypothetical protein [Thermoanaerobaculia bacterium]
MSVQWSATVAAPACGLTGILVVWICRLLLKKKWLLTLPEALVLFLSFSVLPAAVVFCIYPFLSPQPDLKEYFPVLPVAGISLLWTVFATFKQVFPALRVDSSPPENRS